MVERVRGRGGPMGAGEGGWKLRKGVCVCVCVCLSLFLYSKWSASRVDARPTHAGRNALNYQYLFMTISFYVLITVCLVVHVICVGDCICVILGL